MLLGDRNQRALSLKWAMLFKGKDHLTLKLRWSEEWDLRTGRILTTKGKIKDF